jgi:hypothetical protein
LLSLLHANINVQFFTPTLWPLVSIKISPTLNLTLTVSAKRVIFLTFYFKWC